MNYLQDNKVNYLQDDNTVITFDNSINTQSPCNYIVFKCDTVYKTTYYPLYRYIHLTQSQIVNVAPNISCNKLYYCIPVAFTSSNFTAINNDSVTIDIYINDTHKQYTYSLMPQKVNAFIITDYIQFKDKVTSFKVNLLHSFIVNYTSTTQLTAISMHSVHGNIPRDIMYIMFM